MNRHVDRARQGWRKWVDSDNSLAALFFFLVVYGFFIYPLVGRDGRTEPVAAWSFSLVLILGVLATTKHKGARTGMVVLAVIAFTSHWLHYFIREHAVHMISAAAATAFFIALAWLITTRVFRSGGITIYRIYGAIAVYLLLGILWGELYILIYLLNPGSFYFDPSTQCGEPPISELIYFSFTTLTTVGFGDIVPVHPIARSMATLEALVGQLYPAVLLARLVTLYQK
ncbi:MAG: potassium channel family protein [Chthoniobacterales bacterium]